MSSRCGKHTSDAESIHPMRLTYVQHMFLVDYFWPDIGSEGAWTCHAGEADTPQTVVFYVIKKQGAWRGSRCTLAVLIQFLTPREDTIKNGSTAGEAL